MDSALTRSIDGEDAQWGLAEQLLAIAVDRLGMALWQNGGGKGRKPALIPRPGVTKKKVSDVSSHKLEAMTVEQFDARYAARQRHQN